MATASFGNLCVKRNVLALKHQIEQNRATHGFIVAYQERNIQQRWSSRSLQGGSSHASEL
jgi:UDP-glucose 6-dehydrogenase